MISMEPKFSSSKLFCSNDDGGINVDRSPRIIDLPSIVHLNANNKWQRFLPFSIRMIKESVQKFFRISNLKLISCRAYRLVIGLPDEKNESISHSDHHVFESTVKAMERFEYLTIYFRALINGFHQKHISNRQDLKFDHSLFTIRTISSPVHVERRRLGKVDWKNWFIRGVNLVNIFRIGFIMSTQDERMLIYSGDIVFRSKDRLPLYFLILSALITLLISREWFLVLERTDRLSVLHFFDQIRYQGFSQSSLKMTFDQMKQFRRVIHFITISYSRLMILCVPFILILFSIIFLTNPWIPRIPTLAIFGFIWSISICFTIIYQINEIAALSAYLFLGASLHFYRLRSILERRTFLFLLTDAGGLDPRLIRLIIDTIEHFNEFEKDTNLLKYIILHYLTAISFCGDSFIFLGFIVRAYSNLVANMLAAIGLFIMSFSGLACYCCGEFLTILRDLYSSYHRICRDARSPLITQIKILEIMDRSVGHFYGVKIGDLAVISKYFFVIYLMENFAALMLFTVNFKPLINKLNSQVY